MNMRVLLANMLWFAYSAVRARVWRRASKQVQAMQARVLEKILVRNALTAFGKGHGFGTIGSVEVFQKTVPIRSYEDMKPFIDEIAAGQEGVLTSEPVRRFGISSGSTSASKLVPYTAALVGEFQEGIDPWMYNLMNDHPRILSGKTYWSVTPIGDRERRSTGGILIGFGDERAYFNRFTRFVLGTIMTVPAELALVRDMQAFRYATLRFLVQERSLSWVSVWNPTFAALALDPLEGWLDLLIHDVETGRMSVDLGVSPEVDMRIHAGLRKSKRRARELRLIRSKQEGTLYERIWPNLRLISCWAHGNAKDAVAQLRTYFPRAIIQPKGLIATEAFVSFPFRDDVSALSITSHFFEFEAVEEKIVKLAHELETGKRYSVIVTTGGGLYRYRLNDIIEVAGYAHECPLIRFIGRQDKVVDLCGEKLNEAFVVNVATHAMDRSGVQPQFWMVAPDMNGHQHPGYVLFVQAASSETVVFRSLQQEIEVGLRSNFHYDYCRRLGQLRELRIFVIEAGTHPRETYLSVCTEQGQRLGDIKPAALHSFGHWSDKFQGRFV